MNDGDTKLLARNFQTNYGSMKVENGTSYTQNGHLTSNISSQDTRRVVRGPSSRGTVIKYYIKNPAQIQSPNSTD